MASQDSNKGFYPELLGPKLEFGPWRYSQIRKGKILNVPVTVYGFIDETGEKKTDDRIFMCGYACTDDVWNAFSDAWKPKVALAGPIHGTELLSRKGGFYGWDETKADDFTSEVLTIIRTRIPLGIAVGLEVIFPPVMRLIEREVRAAGNGAPLAYHHAHWTRANAPLLDLLGAVIDHVAAHSTGGPTAKENLATACNKCNTQKSAGSSERHLKLHPLKPIKSKYGEPQHWDGLSALFVLLAQRDPGVLTASERDWLKVLAGVAANAT